MLKKIIDTPAFNAMVKGKYGYIVFNKNDTYIGKAVEKYGEFSEEEVKLFKQICVKDDIIIDVGANIGTHTLVFSSLVGEHGRVYAYEPQHIVFQTLCANMAINSVENVECYNLAAHSKTGYAWMRRPDPNIEFNFGALGIENDTNDNKVLTDKLDNLLQLDKLDFVKIKASGKEYEVIKGAEKLIETHKPKLYVQNDRKEKSEKLIEYIRGLDYKMFWHHPTYFNLHNYACDNENIYPNQNAINMLCVHASDNVLTEGFKAVDDA